MAELTLSEPAPTGGLVETLSLAGPSSFTKNGKSTLQIDVPSGSTKVYVSVNASTTGATGQIKVTAKGQFVVRNATTNVAS